MTEPVRRIVTGHDEGGRSVILFDGPSPNIFSSPNAPNLVAASLWETTGTPADNRGGADAGLAPIRLPPPTNGSVFRVIDFPPDSERDFSHAQEALAGFRAGAGAPHPDMHTTNSVDYVIVIEGEIYAVLDTTETLMRAGDCLIQRGTSHAWSNRSDKNCRVAFVLIDAHPYASPPSAG